MLYIASIPGFIIALGMQFSVDSPRWLCKVGLPYFLILQFTSFSTVSNLYFFAQTGRINDAKMVVRELWGESEVESAIQEFQSVSRNDGSDLDSRWSEILEEPHSRGCIKVVLTITFRICMENYSLTYLKFSIN